VNTRPVLLRLSLLLVLLLVQCAPKAAPLSTLDRDVSHKIVRDLHSQEGVVIVDVRQEREYAEGHIPGAFLIPLDQLPERIDEIPQEGRVVLVCRSGNRSDQAFRFLKQRGFQNIQNMIGGMNAWVQAGYELAFCPGEDC